MSVVVQLPSREERAERVRLAAQRNENAGPRLIARAATVSDVAARHADAVEREGRVPHETIQALKDARLLGALVPSALGGEGASLDEVVTACASISAHCAASGMIFALHQSEVSTLVSHSAGSIWHQALIRHMCEAQLLLTSVAAASETGDLQASICALQYDDSEFHLEKNTAVISYGTEADVILAQARRTSKARASDPVLVALLRGQYTLEKIAAWGRRELRGTCSDVCKLDARGTPTQILPKPLGEAAARANRATADLLWSSVWYGVARGALVKAQGHVRAEVNRRPNVMPPGAMRLAEVVTKLQPMKDDLAQGLRLFERLKQRPADLSITGFAVAMNNMKVNASARARAIVDEALQIRGIARPKPDKDLDMDRRMRDVALARLMNDEHPATIDRVGPRLVHNADQETMH